MMLLLGACGRLGFDARATPDAQGGLDAPVAASLIVTMTDDRMAGPATMASLDELAPGTVGLSLREALTIARYRDGADIVELDSSLAGATIMINAELVVGGAGTQIDASKAAVTITPAAGYTGTLLQVKDSDAVIDGLTLQGGIYGIQAVQVSGITVRRVTILDTENAAIQLDGCSNVVVEDNRIERAGGDPLYLHATTGAWVQRNVVVLRTKVGSVHGFWLEEVMQSHIIDNVIDPGEAFLIHLNNSSDNELIGNILDRGDTGITIYGNSARNLVFRNVVISPTHDSVFVEAPATDNKIINNTFFRAADIVDGGTNTMAANNLISDNVAHFAHAAVYDFHLVAGHAAIDAATDLGLDMLPDMPARFLGNKPDTGAVESY
jgi:parallel beta-helix repeat protein